MHFDRVIGLAVVLLSWGCAVLANDCPRSLAEWTAWRAKTIAETKPSELGKLAPFFKQCTEAPACMFAMRDAARAVDALDTPGLTEGKPLGDYFEPSRLDFPKMIRMLPEFAEPAFQKAMHKFERDSRDIRDRLKAIQAKTKGMEIVERDNHFLILVPGEDYDRWYNIGPGLMLIIGMQKRDREHKPINPPRMMFDVQRSADRRGDNGPADIHGQDPWPLERGLNRPVHCARCHQPSGAIGILRETDTKAELLSLDHEKPVQPMVERMNARIAETANAVPDGFSLASFGPPMGPRAALSRTDEFIRACANKDKRALSDEKLGAVRDAMDCQRCHNGRKAGVIRAPLGNDRMFEQNFLNGIVHSGHMPPDLTPALDEESRKALAACLSAEYYDGFKGFGKGEGLLARHILGRKCEEPLRETAPTPRALTH